MNLGRGGGEGGKEKDEKNSPGGTSAPLIILQI